MVFRRCSPPPSGEEPRVSVEDLVSKAKDPNVIGIGETGLDYFYDNSRRHYLKAFAIYRCGVS